MKLIRIIRDPRGIEGKTIADRVEVVVDDALTQVFIPLSIHFGALFFAGRSMMKDEPKHGYVEEQWRLVDDRTCERFNARMSKMTR